MNNTSQKATWFTHTSLFIGMIFCCAIISSCSHRSQPAPVSELYQGKTFRDFTYQAYTQKTYQVRAGDTLYSIAWYAGKDYKDIAKINNILSPYRIQTGRIITLTTISKPYIPKSHNDASKTLKIIINPPVDRSKKQAYGESEQNVNKGPIGPTAGQFSGRVKSWHWPTIETISRGFSAKEQGNKGLDFSGKLGMPILAAADGKVVYTGDALRGFGKLVIIKHSDAYLTAYAHNNEMLVREKQWVTAGQKIATMGRSGTNKVKLHFEVRYKGKSIDPLRYLPSR